MTLFINKKMLLATLSYLVLVSASHATADSTNVTPPTTYKNMNRNIIVSTAITDSTQCQTITNTKMSISAKNPNGSTSTQTSMCPTGYFPLQMSGVFRVTDTTDSPVDGIAGFATLRGISLKNTITCCKFSYQWQ